MIRARMSFSGFADHNGNRLTIEEMEALCAKDQFSGANMQFHAVYSPDPKNPNYKWSAATPSGSVQMFVQNVHAVQDVARMLESASPGKNNPNAREFYVDIYPAPVEDE